MKYNKLVSLFLALLFLLCSHTYAAAPEFSNITKSQFETIVEQFSASVPEPPLAPASSKTLFFLPGFQVGVLGGVTKVPELDEFAIKPPEYLPHTALFASLSGPFGLGVAGTLLPQLTIDQLKIFHYGGAVRWNITDVFFKLLPINLALKGFIGKTELEYSHSLSGLDQTFTLNDLTLGANIAASFKLFLEPYVGVGLLRGGLDFSSTTSAVFDTSFTTSTTASEQSIGPQLFAGLNVSIPFFTIGGQYSYVFQAHRVTLQIALKP